MPQDFGSGGATSVSRIAQATLFFNTRDRPLKQSALAQLQHKQVGLQQSVARHSVPRKTARSAVLHCGHPQI